MTAGIKFHRVTALVEGSSHHKLPSVEGPAVQQALEEIGFEIPYKPYFKLDSSFDIPYLCGYDSIVDKIYFDRDFDPKSYSEGDASTTLCTHEEVEKLLETRDWDYQQRHHVATHCERLMVEYLKWNWASYSRWTTHSWHAAYAKWKGKGDLRVPPTLDMSPYVDEDDRLLKAMREAGAEDKGDEK